MDENQLNKIEASLKELESIVYNHQHRGYDQTPELLEKGGVVTLIDAATVTTDVTNARLFKLTTTQNFAMANPTGGVDGKEILYKIKQDSTGGRLITWGSKFRAPGALGGTLSVAGGKFIHTFTTSGEFVVPEGIDLSVEYLIVGGGGGGGDRGGGGAGGLKTATVAVVPGRYTITIGGGGAGDTSATGNTGGANGSSSSALGVSSDGGGGGGSGNAVNGKDGGSGGGAANTGTAGNGTVGQGNNGGTSSGGAGGGGGGGASAVGANTTGVNGGIGGAGTASSISGASVTYAGGGGGRGSSAGGAGGAGGGGAGAVTNGTVGTPNTGGGGGAGGDNGSNATGAAGGSGVVILSYTATDFIPLLSTSPDYVDYYEFIYDIAVDKWNMIRAVKGFQS